MELLGPVGWEFLVTPEETTHTAGDGFVLTVVPRAAVLSPPAAASL